MRSPLEGNPKTDILFNFLFFLLCCFLQGRVLHGTKAVGDLTGDDLQLPLHRDELVWIQTCIISRDEFYMELKPLVILQATTCNFHCIP
ncbi:uncharacterized protein LOC116257501 isoform X3 [Nymphaea colorata]|uniref:uncharacterized protein LOC116257501 isoform X3 n=1 Tax=Nymphaea colorata TaxID=210225 RepID=UPI00214EF648|nr:uncharacterized protein LOC116257501 isoform X3 [Nymphaea colorata]